MNNILQTLMQWVQGTDSGTSSNIFVNVARQFVQQASFFAQFKFQTKLYEFFNRVLSGRIFKKETKVKSEN